MTEPRWITEGKKYVGTREIPGVKHEARIIGWWKFIRMGGIKTDEVPWCPAYVGAMLKACDVDVPQADYAKAYLDWGVRLDAPVYGCIVVFNRAGGGGGHVGFAIGKDEKGRLMILGGNQSNAVTIAPFDMARVAGYRWPAPGPAVRQPLPLIASSGAASSRNEA